VARPTVRSVVRRLGPAVAALSITGTSLLGLAPPTAACTCFTPDSMAEVATQPRTIVITGAPGSLAARGVPVEVHRWIRGHEPRPMVWLAAWSIGPDDDACDGPAPPVGAPMLFILEMPADGSDPYGGKCAQVARLDTVEGRAALADAVVAFGPGLTIGGGPTGPPVGAAAVPAPILLGAVAVLVGLVAGGFVAVAVAVGRRRP
jgi:hypothetical protein